METWTSTRCHVLSWFTLGAVQRIFFPAKFFPTEAEKFLMGIDQDTKQSEMEPVSLPIVQRMDIVR